MALIWTIKNVLERILTGTEHYRGCRTKSVLGNSYFKQTVKKVIKSIVGSLPGKRAAFSLIRICGVPSFYRSLRFNGVFRVPLTQGRFIRLRCNNSYTLETEWFWRGITGWEAASIQVWMNLCSSEALGRNSVIWDIGACEGIYALVAKTLSPNSRVLAVEPLPDGFRRLKANIALNKLAIDALEVACSGSDGTAKLFIDGDANSTEASLVGNALHHAASTCDVVTRAMSSLIEELGFKSGELVKIDVEGFEPNVLAGMGSYLGKFRPVMIVEILNPKVGEQVNRMMAALDYRYWDINDDPRNGPLGLKSTSTVSKGICLNWLLVPAEKVEPLQSCWEALCLK